MELISFPKSFRIWEAIFPWSASRSVSHSVTEISERLFRKGTSTFCVHSGSSVWSFLISTHNACIFHNSSRFIFLLMSSSHLTHSSFCWVLSCCFSSSHAYRLICSFCRRLVSRIACVESDTPSRRESDPESSSLICSASRAGETFCRLCGVFRILWICMKYTDKHCLCKEYWVYQ